MSRNKEFFHGSNHHFNVGDLIDPSFDSWGGGEAHATNDAAWASTFGESLYQVEPTGRFDMVNQDGDQEHWSGRDPLRVTKVMY